HGIPELCSAVALSVGVALGDGANDQAMLAWLGQLLGAQPSLLVLDNAEHSLDPVRRAPEIWLEVAPELTVLVTSRERLGMPGEVVENVVPLGVPSADEDPSGADAVRLWVARVRTLLPNYELNAAEAAVVAQLVRGLDGLPLAIELAAARRAVISS